MKYYVLAIEGGINPILDGPYETEDLRDDIGANLAATQDPLSDVTFAINVSEDGHLEIWTSSFGM